MGSDVHALHSLSTYLGGFPPRVPRTIIQRWVPARASVLDPFCGSGTTLLEAKLLGHPSVGVDLNPLAVAIARAKLQTVHVDDVLHRLIELAHGFRSSAGMTDVPDALRIIYHERTLAQLCYLRAVLDANRTEDVFLRGALLGIMHGKHRKTNGTAYLSIDMPNTFSMSPNYVSGFVKRHGLRRPPVDVFAKLRERSRWLLRVGPSPSSPRATVLEGDATQLHRILPRQAIHTVGAIVTSPPYLGILRYGAFNWIRLWFLGYDQFSIDRLLDGTNSLDVYLSFMASFLKSAERVLRPGGIVALVVGDVVEYGQHVELAPRVWEELSGLVAFEKSSIVKDRYDETSKTTRIWGEDRKGRATPLDRVLVLRRVARVARASPLPKSSDRPSQRKGEKVGGVGGGFR